MTDGCQRCWLFYCAPSKGSQFNFKQLISKKNGYKKNLNHSRRMKWEVTNSMNSFQFTVRACGFSIFFSFLLVNYLYSWWIPSMCTYVHTSIFNSSKCSMMVSQDNWLLYHACQMQILLLICRIKGLQLSLTSNQGHHKFPKLSELFTVFLLKNKKKKILDFKRSKISSQNLIFAMDIGIALGVCMCLCSEHSFEIAWFYEWSISEVKDSAHWDSRCLPLHGMGTHTQCTPQQSTICTISMRIVWGVCVSDWL